MKQEHFESPASESRGAATESAGTSHRLGGQTPCDGKRGSGEDAAPPAAQSPEDVRRMLHELQVHQVELETQNVELRRSRLELEEINARYFDLFEMAPVGYLTLDASGVIVEANLTAAAILGATKGDLANQSLVDFISGEDRDIFHHHREMVAGSAAQECELRLANAWRGGACWVRLLCAASRNGGYRVTLTDSTELRRHRDHLGALVKERTAELESRNARLEVEIAERKRAEEALFQSEQRFRAVVEDQTELITRHRPDGSYTFVNQAFCRFFGATEDEVLGRNYQPEVVVEDLPKIEKRLGFLSPRNPVVVVENRVISGAGDERWMQFVNRGFFDGEGRLEEIQAVGRDITERKVAEEMLLVYADEVQDLYNNAPCGYHSLDQNGVFVRINDTELGWLGYQRHEVIGVKRLVDLVTDEGAAVIRTNFPKFMEVGGLPCNLELEMVRKDGSRLPVIVDAVALRDADGGYLTSRGTVFNNTERKEAEKERRRSEERFRGIFENAPFGIFQTALDNRLLSANPTLAHMFGYQSPELMVREVTDVANQLYLHPEQRSGVLQRTEPEGRYLQEEFECRRRDGSHFIGNFNVRAVHAEGGTFLEGFLEDITSRREAEQALQKSELQFRQMAETIEEVFWLTSAVSHALLYISPGYARIWGRPCAELYADPRLWMEAILPEDLPQVRRDLDELARGNAVQLEYRIRRPDGTLRWIGDRGYPLRDAAGTVTLVTGVASDITERKEAEESLANYAQRLIVLEEDLRKRIAMELHDDIGQTLTALGLNLAHIGNRLQQEAGNDLRSIFQDSRQLTKEISRSVRNLMVDLRPTQLEEYGLPAAIRSHAEQYALRTGMSVSVLADPSFPRLTAKQEIALFRISQEALNNVSKHAAATKVKVSLRSRRGSLRLSISDDGAGFLPQATSPRPSGSGWGLTIMRERAELVGGVYRIDSVPGQGTTVTIEIKGRG